MEFSEEENSEDSSSYEETNFKAELEKEKSFWENYFINNYVYMPEKCSKCQSKHISIGNKNSLSSPKILLCNKNKCKHRQSLRNYSFLLLFKQIRCSYIMKFLKYFILDQKMVQI